MGGAVGIARGTIRSVDASPALALPGVLAVITPDNAPRLPGTGDPELALFQTRAVAYRGQFVAAVVAVTLETAREAAGRVVIDYEQAAHDVTLTAGHPGLYKPDFVNPRYETDTAAGDLDGAFAAAAVRVDATYRTPAEHNHPVEPHATVAAWHDGTLTVYDATQGSARWARRPPSPARCTTPPGSGSATCPSGSTSCPGRARACGQMSERGRLPADEPASSPRRAGAGG